MNDSVRVAKINRRAAREALASQALLEILRNPLGLGIAALAANYGAYRAGLYKGTPERSLLGGPVWITIGTASDPAVEQFARYEAFIMTATAALAISGGVKGLAGLGSLTGILKGVAS